MIQQLKFNNRFITISDTKLKMVPTGKRGRAPVAESVVHTMRKMRLDPRFTLSDIAYFIGVSQLTVFKYTKGIASRRRHNTTSTIHRRTGLAA